MNNGSKIPTKGSRIRVRIGNYSYDWMNRHPSHPIEGIVADNHSWQDPDSFRLCPVFTFGIGESIISLDRVVSIEFIDSNEVIDGPGVEEIRSDIADVRTWPVKGSKGQDYTVTRKGKMWSCNCIAGGYGRACKHVSAVKKMVQA